MRFLFNVVCLDQVDWPSDKRLKLYESELRSCVKVEVAVLGSPS